MITILMVMVLPLGILVLSTIAHLWMVFYMEFVSESAKILTFSSVKISRPIDNLFVDILVYECKNDKHHGRMTTYF